MSGTSPVELATPSHEDDIRSTPTRTLAIIKTHALEHRLAIERRILEANFEIVKERQMEFDTSSDQDFLQELFGRDTDSLFDGPVWVYVLERRRAVEVWNALMGDTNPEVARQISPNSLRAVYGSNEKDNALAGSPDVATAEEQISCLFQSSPPFSSTDLPSELDEHTGGDYFEGQRSSFDSEYAHHDDIHHPISPRRWAAEVSNPLSPSTSSTAQQSDHAHSRYGSETRSRKSSGGTGSDSGSKSGGVLFRARPLPKTTHVPESQPRLTRAAALRAGAAPVDIPLYNKPRATVTKEELKRVFMDVPGHKRSSTIQVASTAPPVVAPRMTRAAALRIGQPLETTKKPVKPRPTSMLPDKDRNAVIFDGVPGHKRRESFSVASVQAPTVAPRLNKSAELRAKKESLAPPSSYQFRTGTAAKIPPAITRTNSSQNLSANKTSTNNPSSSRPPSRGGRLSLPLSRSTSVLANHSNNQDVPASAIVRPPSIEPRSNRSALLRAKAGTPTPSTPPVSGRKPVRSKDEIVSKISLARAA